MKKLIFFIVIAFTSNTAFAKFYLINRGGVTICVDSAYHQQAASKCAGLKHKVENAVKPRIRERAKPKNHDTELLEAAKALGAIKK